MSIHDEILGNLPEMRRELASRYKWYVHITPSKNAGSIHERGLIPNRDKPADELISRYFGETASNIICLNPLGADDAPPAVQCGPYICLALEIGDLPQRFSLDWSYGGSHSLAPVLREDYHDWPASRIFCECLKRRGSILVYDQIRPEALRVLVNGRLPHNPARWPYLREAADDALLRFG